MKILLLLMPFWDPLVPPNGIAHLKSYLTSKGFNILTRDLTISVQAQDTYQRYFESIQNALPEKKSIGEIVKVGHDVLNTHLFAEIHRKKNDTRVTELLNDCIYKHYYAYISKESLIILQNILQAYLEFLSDLIKDVIEEDKPEIIGFTLYSGTLASSLFAARVIKKYRPKIRVVAGGGIFAETHTYLSYNFNKLLEVSKGYIDNFFIGRGEILLEKYLKNELDTESIVFREQDYKHDSLKFTDIPIPDYSDFDLRRYPYICASSSSSCPYSCSFCNTREFWGKYKVKDISQTIKEMVELHRRTNKQLFYMTDSLLNPTIDELSHGFSKIIHPLYLDAYLRVGNESADFERTKAWRRSGIYRVRMGCESGSQRILNKMNKQITVQQIKNSLKSLADSGIKTTTYWVAGHPGESEEDFNETLSLIEELKDSIFQAECAPFKTQFNGQSGSQEWDKQIIPVYNKQYSDLFIFNLYDLETTPDRYTIYSRLQRFYQHCESIGIPNPYSLKEHLNADHRWSTLHESAVPGLINFISGKSYVNDLAKENLKVTPRFKVEKSTDFNF